MGNEKVNLSVGGLQVFGADERMARVLRGRDEFIKKYCAEKGWDLQTLKMEQILEIRKQDGWKNPVNDESAGEESHAKG